MKFRNRGVCETDSHPFTEAERDSGLKRVCVRIDVIDLENLYVKCHRSRFVGEDILHFLIYFRNTGLIWVVSDKYNTPKTHTLVFMFYGDFQLT